MVRHPRRRLICCCIAPSRRWPPGSIASTSCSQPSLTLPPFSTAVIVVPSTNVINLVARAQPSLAQIAVGTPTIFAHKTLPSSSPLEAAPLVTDSTRAMCSDAPTNFRRSEATSSSVMEGCEAGNVQSMPASSTCSTRVDDITLCSLRPLQKSLAATGVLSLYAMQGRANATCL